METGESLEDRDRIEGESPEGLHLVSFSKINKSKARPEMVYKHRHSGGGLGLTTQQAEVRTLSPKTKQG